MLVQSTYKSWTVGLIVLAIIGAVMVAFDVFPELDGAPSVIEANAEPREACFQGFCVEIEDERSLLAKWWEYSVEYLRLVSTGLVLATLAGAATKAFFFPGPWSGRGRGIVSNALMDAQSVAGLHVPSLVVAILVFAPLLGISRAAIAVVGSIALGMLATQLTGPDDSESRAANAASPAEGATSWGSALSLGLRDWAVAASIFFLRLLPAMLVAALIGGFLVQAFSPETLDSAIGNTGVAVAIAATVGLLIRVPLLFEIPLVAMLLVVGMGVAPAATLLFAASAGGVLTFSRLARRIPARSVATVAGATWIVAAAGGLVVLGADALLAEETSTSGGSRVVAEVLVDNTEKDPALINDSQRDFLVGPLAFFDVTDSAGVEFTHIDPDVTLFPIGAGVVVFDYNNDGFHDIYVPQTDGPNALFKNQQDGSFVDVAVQAGVDVSDQDANGGCAADYDNDGFQDLYVTIRGSSKLFHNRGDGTFEDATSTSLPGSDRAFRSTGCAWGDYDGDSNLDLVVVRHMYEQSFEILNTRAFHEAVGGMAFYHNDGDGTFSDALGLLGDTSGPKTDGSHLGNVWGAGFQPGWVDYDNDGDVDLFVVNDFGREIQPNVLWRNDGRGPDGRWRFVDISETSGVNVQMDGMGLAVGDYDLDGFLDMFVTNIGDNVLFRNSGDGSTFLNTTEETGAGVGMIGRKIRIAWGAFFFDYDNDADEDLYIVSGYLPVHQPANPRDQRNVLLHNSSNGSFVDVSASSGADDAGIGRGGVYLDFNNDGCLDLFVVNYGQKARLYENACESVGNWLVVKTIGGESNRDGVGARLTLEAGGRTQIREIAGGSSSIGQNMIEAHFGLDQIDVVDSLSIRWPSGTVQTLTDIPANQRIVVNEADTS